MDILEPIIENLGVDWKMFLSQLINFGIIFFVLKKFAFMPLQKMLMKREKKIKKGLEDADKAASELEMAQVKYDEKIGKARAKANEIVADAEKQHKEILTQAEQEAQEKAQQIVRKARQKTKQEREQMVEEVKQQTVDLSLLATEKILQKKLTDEENREFIEELLNAKK